MRARGWRVPLGRRGFSVMEMMVVVSLVSWISAVAYYVSAVQTWTSNRENANAVAQNAVRVALERIVRDLQLVGFDPTASGNFGFDSAHTTGQEVRFTTDTNRDGLVSTGEGRGFDFSSGSIRALLDGSATSVLATGVQSLTFSYLDALGNTTTTVSNIREVRITATVLAQGRSPGIPASLHTLVGTAYMRNG